MDLNETLNRFDAIEANLARVDRVLEEYEALVPEGIVFTTGSPEGLRADELLAAYAELVACLPAIDSWRIDAQPVPLDDVARTRMDAADIGEPEVLIGLSEAMAAPAREVAAYRRKFTKQRRALVRGRAREVLDEIDEALSELSPLFERDGTSVDHSAWDRFQERVAELERLLGASVLLRGRWPDLKRHIRFGLGGDLRDIIEHDWPDVRRRIVEGLYDALEPLPVGIEDLATAVAEKPSGPVSTQLAWDKLEPDDFERLLFNLLTAAANYENVQWAMHTNAPDRGRDIAADRISRDSLSGVQRQRVAVQCKHWRSRSVRPDDLVKEIASVELWDHPPVDVLIVATSGRFTMDAISWVEKHNAERKLPRIEIWPESHLESLLAQRSDLVSEFQLRSR